MEVDSWVEYRRLVIDSLDRLDRSINELNHQVASLRTDIETQKVRTGLLGAAAGAVPGLIAALIWYINRD